MKIIIDTNFILTAIKQKIDFSNLANQLLDEKVEFVVPVEVTKELGKILQRQGEKTAHKQAAQTALQIIEPFDEVPLGTTDVDTGIVRYAKNNKVVIATLDKELKNRLGKNQKILTIRAGKKLELI